MSTYVLFRNRFVFHEFLQFLQVFKGIKGHADTFAAVTSGTSGLLIISFQTLRHVIVDNIPDVGLVNTHAESNRSNDDINAFHQEVVLRLCTGCSVHSGMIGSCFDVIGDEYFCQIFHLLAAEAINNTAFALVILNETDDVLFNILGLRPYFVEKVGTVEGASEVLRFNNAEVLLNIHPHLVGSRSCESYDRCSANGIDGRTYFAVFNSKVVSPF